MRDGCWLSEGWTPKTFQWTPEESGTDDEDPIYLHLVHEGGSAIWLPKQNGFKIELMCPPTCIEYFFTVKGEQVVADNQPQEHSKLTHYDVIVNM